MYARLEDNIVVEIIDYNTIEDKFTPQFVAQCVPCGASTEVGMVWDGETFAPVPGLSLDELRAAKQAEIRDKADVVLKARAAEYPDMEMATWDQQYQEALAYTADSAAATPLLSAIAQGRSMAVAELAARIINNRAAWVAASGAIVGQRLAYQYALDAATTAEEIEAIQVEYAA